MRDVVGKPVGSIVALAVAALLAVAGLAVADKPVKSISGNIETEFNGGFSPKKLSKTKPTPIAFDISGRIRTLDGEHPPALKQFLLEGDKHATLSVKGIPICKSGQIQATDTARARAACGKALIGSGKTEVEIKFPEQPAIYATSELLVLNGGFRGGVTTLFIHAYITVPTPATVITTVKIKKIKKGRYGLQSIASIPKIAGGSGSVIFFRLALKKGILSATCPDGHLNARGTAVFADGTSISGAVVRPCTPAG